MVANIKYESARLKADQYTSSCYHYFLYVIHFCIFQIHKNWSLINQD